MASTNKTTNYQLSQFGDTDKPTWRGDYTSDMAKIDAGMNANKLAAQTAQQSANDAVNKANEAKDAATGAGTDGKNAVENLKAMGVTDTASATELKTKIDNTATQSASNTANLTALGADTSSNAAAVAAKIAQIDSKADAGNVYSRTDSDNRYLQKGGYTGTAQSLSTSINQNTNDLTDLKPRMSAVETRANGSLPTTFIQYWHGASGNTDGNGIQKFTVPVPDGAEPTSIFAVPFIDARGSDTSLQLDVRLWSAGPQAGNTTCEVQLRYLNPVSRQWVTGAQPSQFLACVILFSPKK